MLTIQEYKKLRKNFIPKKIKYIFVLESPPVGGNYFYKCDNIGPNPLFHEMMKVIKTINYDYPFINNDTFSGLKYFQNSGYLIIDSTYTPVNNIPEGRQRNDMILKNINYLKNEIKEFIKTKGSQNTKIILIKRNICTIIKKELLKDFNSRILNRNEEIIPFPSNGHQRKFREKVVNLIKENERNIFKK